MTYTRILAGRHHERNRCYTENDERLRIANAQDKMKGRLAQDAHFFVGLRTGKPAVYGWVKELEQPITAEAYLAETGGNPTPEDVQLAHHLLQSIAKQAPDTPVACHFQEVGIIEKRRRLVVHKVLFYPK